MAQHSLYCFHRILCRKNQTPLGVLNGDLGTVVSADRDYWSLPVRPDRDPITRELPAWYLHKGNVDCGYAMTGHKAQGVTTGRTFVIVDGTINRVWAYAAMSRGREGNTLYLTYPEHEDHRCTHRDRTDVLDALPRPWAAARLKLPPSTTPPDRDRRAATSSNGSPGSRRSQAERNEPERRSPWIEFAAGR
jgi:hypothetical protein